MTTSVKLAKLSLLLVASGTIAPVTEAAGPLLPCGGTESAGGDSQQVIVVFNFVKGVCSQVGEACPASSVLPTSCATTECQRAVQLAVDSCQLAFSKDGFLKTAFGGILDTAAALCATAHPRVDSVGDPVVRAGLAQLHDWTVCDSCGPAVPHTRNRARAPPQLFLADESMCCVCSASSWPATITTMCCPSRHRMAGC